MIQQFKKVEGPAAWYGRDFEHNDEWIYHLSSKDIQELDHAITAFHQNGRQLNELQYNDIPLPYLGQQLHTIQKEVVHGRGFQLIKGLPVERYGKKDATIAYWLMGLYMGEAVPQMAKDISWDM